MIDDSSDVIVIGGGNAALCAALSAAEMGAQVALLESAPKNLRGGNSSHTRNLRIQHDAPMGVLQDCYPHQTYLDDLLKVTDGETDTNLANLLIGETTDCYGWMQKMGVNFQQALSGTLSLAHSNAFFWAVARH